VIAYKFLLAGRTGAFSGHVWPAPGDGWVEAGEGLVPCASGVHACRPRDLPYWIAEELWRVELDGEIAQHELKVVAPRGRLVERVEAWDSAMRDRFADHCLRRVTHHAAAQLRSAGLEKEADVLVQAGESGTAEELARVAGEAAAAAAAGRRRARHAGHLAEYVVDASEWLSDAAGMGFVAARAADSRTAYDEQVDDPFVRERELQAEWLEEALGLAQTG
jgi:hypothetical protein